MRSTPFLFAVPALLSLAIVGCGDDTADDDGSSSGSESTTSSSSGGLTSSSGSESSTSSSSGGPSSSSSSGSESSTSSSSGGASSSSGGASSSSGDVDAGDGGVTPPPATTYSIGGTVSGLLGSGLVLHVGDQDKAIDADGPFTFDTKLPEDTSYIVTATDPTDPTQHCSVSSGSGSLLADKTDVTVVCSTTSFAIGGKVVGLPAGTSITLKNNGGDATSSLDENGNFTFATDVASGADYDVTVSAQPAGAGVYCAVTSGIGTVGAADVSDVNVSCNTVKTCAGVLQMNPDAPNGTYSIQVGGTKIDDVYCDMQGGGWMLALKADGNEHTFAYDSASWTDSTRFGTATLDTTEAKLTPFVYTSATAVRIDMVTGAESHTASLGGPPGSPTLQSVVTGAYTATALGRAAWLSLVPGSSLQIYCNEEGYGVSEPNSSVRIGILGNENGVDDCTSPDSFLGIGGINNCGGAQPSVGNVGCDDSRGADGNSREVSIASFGYVWVK